MKIILSSAVILLFGLIGFFYKQKFKEELFMYCYIKKFNKYYQSNITLFKNNIVEIINKYIIMQNNKNANYNKIFIKNNNIFSINKEFLDKYILNKLDSDLIINYFNNLGKYEYNYEIKKLEEFDEFLNLKIKNIEDDIKNKGDLYFKILLAIGAVVAILIW